MNISLNDIANALTKIESVDPKVLKKVSAAAKAAGVNIQLRNDEERKTLNLIAKLMDEAEDTYSGLRGKGESKLSSVLQTAISILAKENMSILDIIQGVTKFAERLKQIYKALK